MSRQDEFTRDYEKPADKYIEWAGKKGTFTSWNKDSEELELEELPFKFIILMERHTVKGFDEDSDSGIYSNEVEDLSKEILTVKSFNGGLIAKGLYADIKDEVSAAGGFYAKSFYVMTIDGEVWNVSMKGSAVFAWGEFVKKSRSQLVSHSVTVSGYVDKKKGSNEYMVPTFEWGAALSAKRLKQADQAYDDLVAKLSANSARSQAITSKEEAETSKTNKPEIPKVKQNGGNQKKKQQEETFESEDNDFPDPDDMPNEAEIDF